MPRYHFHLKSCDEWIYDREGRLLRDVDAAVDNAFLEARSLVADAVLNGEPAYPASFIVIADEQGNEIARVPYEEAVEIR